MLQSTSNTIPAAPSHQKSPISSPEQTIDGNVDDVSVTSVDNISEPTTTFMVAPPVVPANTPATQSVVEGMTLLDLNNAHDTLAQLSDDQGLGTSEASNPPSSPTAERIGSVGSADEGKARLRRPVRSDVSLLTQLFKAPPSKMKKELKRAKNAVVDRASTPKPKKDHDVSPPNEHVHEHSVWEDVAKEDLQRGLERAAQYAKDMVRINDSKNAEEYFSELLAEAIKGGDMKFDTKYLE